MGETPRKARRTRHCPKCRYDVQGLPYGTPCPECGQSLLVEDVAEYRRKNTPLPFAYWTYGFVAMGVAWFLLFTKLVCFAPIREGSIVAWIAVASAPAFVMMIPLCVGWIMSRMIRRPFVRGSIRLGWVVAGVAIGVLLIRRTSEEAYFLLPFMVGPLVAAVMAIHGCGASLGFEWRSDGE